MNLLKIISVLLLLAFSISFSYADSGDKYYSNAYKLNVRANPSIDGKIIGELKKGHTVVEYGSSETGWRKIQLKDGKIGYARDKYLLLNESNDNRLLGNSGIVNARSVFVRSDSTFNSRVNAIVKEGEKLKILCENIINDHFIKVEIISGEYAGRVGFIGKKYLDVLVSTDIYINNSVSNPNNLMINLNYGTKSFDTIEISDDISETLENIFTVDNQEVNSFNNQELDLDLGKIFDTSTDIRETDLYIPNEVKENDINNSNEIEELDLDDMFNSLFKDLPE